MQLCCMVGRAGMDLSNTCKGASVWIGRPVLLKGTPVFVLLAVIGIIVLTSITALVVDVKKDGYRRAPERELIPFL